MRNFAVKLSTYGDEHSTGNSREPLKSSFG